MVTQCPNCKTKFKARDDWKGKVTKCPKCQQPFTVGEVAAGPQPAPKAPPTPAAPQSKPVTAAPAASKPAQRPQPAPKAGPAPAPQPAVQAKPAPAPRPLPQVARRTGPTETMSDTLYVYSVLCALVLSVFSFFLGQLCMKEREASFQMFGKVLVIAGAVLGIYSMIIILLMYYKMWTAIQDENSRISPGKAVGLLFVPVLNIFWAVYMLVVFARDYEDFADGNSIYSERMSKGLMVQYALLWVFVIISFVVLCILPQFGIGVKTFGRIYPTFAHSTGLVRVLVITWKMSNILITLWLFVVYGIVSSKICRGINAL